MSISAAPNHNNAAGLQALNPQPEYSGRQFAQTNATPNGIFREGEYVVLSYPIIEATDFVTVLTRLGLTSAESAEITIRLPGDDLTTFANYNATAQRTRRERPDGTCWRSVQFIIRKLEVL